MKPYHKINNIFTRDNITGKLNYGDWSSLEFDSLKDADWRLYEKIDGTNIRIIWHNGILSIRGRSDNSQIPAHLLDILRELFPHEKLVNVFGITDKQICLYGEGFGFKIQKTGYNYDSKKAKFALFDININDFWLDDKTRNGIATALGCEEAPFIRCENLIDALKMVESGLCSSYGKFIAEGIIAKPKCELLNQQGHRIIAKIKTIDFLFH